MWWTLAGLARNALIEAQLVPEDHPVWSDRPYVVYLYTPDDVFGRIDYVDDNPEKHGLPRQHWTFVKPYDGWPYPRGHSRR
jgi:hypothetical protein